MESDSRELLMMLSGGDKKSYDSYLATEVREFWGLVWDFEKRNRKKLKNYKHARTSTRHNSQPESGASESE